MVRAHRGILGESRYAYRLIWFGFEPPKSLSDPTLLSWIVHPVTRAVPRRNRRAGYSQCNLLKS